MIDWATKNPLVFIGIVLFIIVVAGYLFAMNDRRKNRKHTKHRNIYKNFDRDGEFGNDTSDLFDEDLDIFDKAVSRRKKRDEDASTGLFGIPFFESDDSSTGSGGGSFGGGGSHGGGGFD